MTQLTPAQLAERAVDAAKEIEALHARAEAAEAQVAALMNVRLRAEALLRTSYTEGIAGIIGVDPVALGALEKALSSLPASPATEKLQARVKGLEELGRLVNEFLTWLDHQPIGEGRMEYAVLTQIIIPKLRRAASALKGEG